MTTVVCVYGTQTKNFWDRKSRSSVVVKMGVLKMQYRFIWVLLKWIDILSVQRTRLNLLASSSFHVNFEFCLAEYRPTSQGRPKSNIEDGFVPALVGQKSARGACYGLTWFQRKLNLNLHMGLSYTVSSLKLFSFSENLFVADGHRTKYDLGIETKLTKASFT